MKLKKLISHYEINRPINKTKQKVNRCGLLYMLHIWGIIWGMTICSPTTALANDGFIDAMKELNAESFVILEASTGKLLYEKNGSTRFYFSEPINMATAASISTLAKSDHESVATKIKHCQTSELAVAILQTLENYAEYSDDKINKGITELNLQNTGFMDSDILYTSAYDLGKIAVAGFKNPRLRQMLEKNTYDVSHTRPVGECYFAYGTEDNLQVEYIAVVMNTAVRNAKKETRKILKWAPMLIQMRIIHKMDDLVKPIRISGGMANESTARPAKNIQFPVTANIPGVFPASPDGGPDDEKFSLKIELYDPIEAPVKDRQKVGTVLLLYNGKEFDQVDMLADQSIEKFSLVQLITGWFTSLYQNIVNLFH